MSWCLVQAALEGFHRKEFQSDIRWGTLRWNFLWYHWEGCMWSMQCNVEFGYQLSICSGTKENHGKCWSSWPVAGPSGCKLTSSPQFGTKYASPNTSPYLCFFSFPFLWNHLQVFFTKIVSLYNLDKHKNRVWHLRKSFETDQLYTTNCPPRMYIKQIFFYFSQIYIGAISKYVVRKHLVGVIIQWWFFYIYCALYCVCLYSSSSLWSFKSEGHCRFSLHLTFNGLLNSVT
jgi:hypothetical protein